VIVSIHQPSYWPWFGLLDKIARSHVYVCLDTVALNKEAFTHRNLVQLQGKKRYLTLPIDYHMGTPICQTRFKSDGWPSQHVDLLGNYYRKARFFRDVQPEVEAVLMAEPRAFLDVVNETMRYAMERFSIGTEIVAASSLGPEGKKGGLVLDICRKVGATAYLSGRGALDYLTEEDRRGFDRAGIELRLQEFEHPVYQQTGATEFVPGMSCLDFLYNCGFEEASILFEDREETP